MQGAVFAGRTAFCLSENMGKMGRGYKPDRLADFGDAPVRVHKQFLCLAASDHMMISQGRHMEVPFEGPHQVTAVDIERAGDFLQ